MSSLKLNIRKNKISPINNKKAFVIFAVLLILIVISGLSSSIVNFLIRDNTVCHSNFPEKYDIKDVRVYINSDSKHSLYTITIDGNGSVYYYGSLYENEYCWVKTGVLPEEDVRDLISVFRDNKFFCLSDINTSDQMQSYLSLRYFFILELKIGNVTKTFNAVTGKMPSEVISIINATRNSVNSLPNSQDMPQCLYSIKRIPPEFLSGTDID